MTDDELDLLVSNACLPSDGRITSLDLGDAETELMEEIVATSGNDPTLDPLRHDDDHTWRRRHRAPFALVAVAATVALGVVTVQTIDKAGNDMPEVVAQAPEPTEVPRLLAGWVPTGFELANTTEESPSGDGVQFGDDTPSRGSLVSYVAYYAPPTPGPDGLPWIQVTTQDAGSAALGRTGTSASGRHATVRGRDGVLVVNQPHGSLLGSIQLAWEETPGVHVTVSAWNSELTESDVVAMAESLEAVTAEEWANAAHLNDPADAATIEALIPDSARASIIFEHRGGGAYLDSDGQACAFLADNRGQTPVTCRAPEARVHVLADRIGWPALLFGTMPKGATNILATRNGADVADAPEGIEVPPSVFLDAAADGGPTLYAVALGLLPDSITFLDDRGQAVETLPLDLEPDL